MNESKELRETYNVETDSDELEFLGFENPKENWSKLPHELIAALPLIETIAEMKVILYVLRHTWGYRDDSKRISQDEFANGRKKVGGGRLDNGTGLSVNAIKDGIERAIEHGFLEIADKDDSDAARVKTWYRLKMHLSNSDSRVSNFDTLPSEVDTRTKKETLERKEHHPAANGKEPSDKPNPFQVWESIGLSLSPYITQTLTEWERDYSVAWVCEAIRRAAKANKRNLNYIRGILERWKAKGEMDYPTRAEAVTPAPIEMPEYQKHIKWVT